MSDATATTGSGPYDEDAGRRGSGLFSALAWIGIVAGVVVTVAVIFFSGFLIGRASDNYRGWQRGYQGAQLGPAGQGQGGCPMMRNGAMMGPGGMEPDRMEPDQPESTTRPSPVPPPSQR
jgi:hypothetical protein